VMQRIVSAPQISVVCAWYNRADYIRDTVDSLLAQECDSFEIVIINDGSPDPNVRKILDSYSDARLRIIHQENTGFTIAIRRAIGMAKAPLVAIQGAGDISFRNRLREQAAVFDQYPDVAIVGSHYTVNDLTVGDIQRRCPKTPKMGALTKFGFSHGELMYRRSVYDEVGGYRPLFYVGQGSDLWTRMLRKHKAYIVAEPLYEQRIFRDGVSKDDYKLAARALLNAIRIENEAIFRKTGIDHLNIYGSGGIVILSSTLRVRLKVIALHSLLMSRSNANSISPYYCGPIARNMSILIAMGRKLKGYLKRRDKKTG